MSSNDESDHMSDELDSNDGNDGDDNNDDCDKVTDTGNSTSNDKSQGNTASSSRVNSKQKRKSIWYRWKPKYLREFTWLRYDSQTNRAWCNYPQCSM